MTKKSQEEFRQAKAHVRAAYQDLTELHRRKLDELRQVEDKIDAMNSAVGALFGKGSKT